VRGSLVLSNGAHVYVRPEDDHLYCEYGWEGAHHQHDCLSVEAQIGGTVQLVLATGKALVLFAPSKYDAASWGATAPVVTRIVCGNDHGGHVADGVWFTTDWKRHVGNEA